MGSLAVLALLINSFFLNHASVSVRTQSQPAGTPRQQGTPSQPPQQEHLAVNSWVDNKPQDTALAAARQATEEAAAARARYIARYLNSANVHKPSGKSATVFIVGENMMYNRAVSSAIAMRLQTNSVQILSDLFQPEFVSDGLFSRSLTGATQAFENLELSKCIDVLLLGREEVQYETDRSLDNLVSAHLRLEIVAFFISGSGGSQSWAFTSSGSGFKQIEARTMAEERILKQIANDTRIASSL